MSTYNIITIEKDIFIYQFGPEKDKFLGLNIFMIKNGDECVLIDTGFRRHFVQVSKDLKEKGIKISKVILTHFHPDHIGGIPRAIGADIIGSIYAEDNLKKYVEDYQNYLPTIVVEDQKEIKFGRHTFKMQLNSGHSKDGLLIALNDKYLFVGDDVIADNLGNASIPFCSEKVIDDHIHSIKKIMSELGNKYLLPTHGKLLDNKEDILKDLIPRLTYLHYINENREATYEQFSKETNISFLGRDWHVLNQINEVK